MRFALGARCATKPAATFVVAGGLALASTFPLVLASSASAQEQYPGAAQTEGAPRPKLPAERPKPKAPPAAATPAVPRSVEADVAFWNSVKDTQSAAQIQAYLNRFPEGNFAELARIKLKELQASASGGPAPAPPSGGLAQGGTALVREVQQRLYDLNFPVTRNDGSLDQETESAIKQWQRLFGHTPSGRITPEQLQQLRGLKPAPSWAAIAYTPAGRAFAVSGQPSRRQSESRALAECLKASGSACNVRAVAANSCLAFGFGSRPEGTNTRSIFAFGAGPTVEAAKVQALATCSKQGYANCGVPAEVCARIGVTPEASKAPATGQSPPAGTTAVPPAPRPTAPAKKKSDQDA